MFSEISPVYIRGKSLLILNLGVSIGKLFGIFIAVLCLESFHKGNWRLMMFLSSLPNLIVIYGSIFVLEESPRFLAAQRKF